MVGSHLLFDRNGTLDTVGGAFPTTQAGEFARSNFECYQSPGVAAFLKVGILFAEAPFNLTEWMEMDGDERQGWANMEGGTEDGDGMFLGCWRWWQSMGAKIGAELDQARRSPPDV